MDASNNWGVSPAKSMTGSALYASDPHLHILQLPPIWNEIIAYVGPDQQYRYGITVPGS